MTIKYILVDHKLLYIPQYTSTIFQDNINNCEITYTGVIKSSLSGSKKRLSSFKFN